MLAQPIQPTRDRARAAGRRVLTQTCAAGLALATGIAIAAAPSLWAGESEANANAEVLDLETLFGGEWTMKGRFRPAAGLDWIQTGSHLVARKALAPTSVLREIEAPQIGFRAIDWVSYNPETGKGQYLYMNHRDTTALVFEGSVTEDGRSWELDQVCGAAWRWPKCDGRTTMTFLEDDVFVARDFRSDESGEEFMSREVYYTRVSQ